jgi:hypothetical protein
MHAKALLAGFGSPAGALVELLQGADGALAARVLSSLQRQFPGSA